MDPGERAIQWLYAQLKIDDYWAERTPDGFRWWADKQAQTIEVAGREEGGPDNATAALVAVRTDVLRGVELDDERRALLNSRVMSFASMAGLVYDTARRTLSLCTLARVLEDNESWVDPFLSMAAVLQIEEARAIAASLAGGLGAESAISGHPARGVRALPDEMAGAVEALVVPTGRRTSVWSPVELQAAAGEIVKVPGVTSLAPEPGGLTADIAFGDLPSRCQVLADVPHPRYGSGLLLLHQFPMAPPTEPEGAGLALALNEIELSRAPLGYGFGSYAWRGERIYFISFLPNALYRAGLLPSLVASCARRAGSLHPLVSAPESPVE